MRIHRDDEITDEQAADLAFSAKFIAMQNAVDSWNDNMPAMVMDDPHLAASRLLVALTILPIQSKATVYLAVAATRLAEMGEETAAHELLMKGEQTLRKTNNPHVSQTATGPRQVEAYETESMAVLAQAHADAGTNDETAWGSEFPSLGSDFPLPGGHAAPFFSP